MTAMDRLYGKSKRSPKELKRRRDRLYEISAKYFGIGEPLYFVDIENDNLGCETFSIIHNMREGPSFRRVAFSWDIETIEEAFDYLEELADDYMIRYSVEWITGPIQQWKNDNSINLEMR